MKGHRQGTELPPTLDKIRAALRQANASTEEEIEAWTVWILEHRKPRRPDNHYEPNCEALRAHLIATENALAFQADRYLQGLHTGLTIAHDLVSFEKWHRLKGQYYVEEDDSEGEIPLP